LDSVSSGHVMGTAKNCLLKGRTIINGAMKLIDGSSFDSTAEIEFGGTAARLTINNYQGPLAITEMNDAAHTADIYSDGDADITLNATDTLGTATFLGIGNKDTTGAVTTIVDADWAELPFSAAGLTAQQVRDAMKRTPAGGAPAADSVDEHLDDLLTGQGLQALDSDTAKEATVVSGVAAILSEGGSGPWTTAALSQFKKNAAFSNFPIFMVADTDHVSGKTGLTLVGTISKDGGAFAPLTNASAEIGNGFYKVDLTAAEMNADSIDLLFADTGADDRAVSFPTNS